MAPVERAIARISRGELERRWKLVREHLSERGLDALLVQGKGHDTQSGYVRWLLGRPAGSYMHALLFPARDPAFSVEHGGMGRRRKVDGEDPEYPGVGEIATTASISSVHYTGQYESEILAQEIKRRGYRKIAVAGLGAMPHGFITGLEQRLGAAAELADDSEFIDQCKAIKSPEEIEQIKQTTAMQDLVFQAVLAQIRPGMREVEVTALARREGELAGSDGDGVFLAGSAAPGSPAPLFPHHLQGRRIEAGDQLTLLIENNGAAGYFAELARVIVVGGKASSELKEAFEACRAAQQQTVGQFRAQAWCKEIFESYSHYLSRAGMAPEARLYSHGQGLDLVERPLIRQDETMQLQENMFLACHPSYVSGSLFCFICDNYFVGSGGPSACVHRTAKQIFEV